ncbi:MAG TPA: tetratricopeptide repeat protein [Candidatus Manganitrophaceae bacterium]|nr:tetratricopeptide repeat protein [Candidatus Manganitrophaceae bacterium]
MSLNCFVLAGRSFLKEKKPLLRSSFFIFFSLFLLYSTSIPASAAGKDDSALFFEGHSWMEKKKPEKAIPLFEEGLSQYPQSKIRDLTYFWLGRAYLETHQVEKSKNTLSQIQKEFPGSPLIPKLEKLIVSKEAGIGEKKKREEKVAKSAPPSKKEEAAPAEKAPAPEKPQAPRAPVSRPAEGFLLVIPQVADLRAEPSADEKHGYPGDEIEFPLTITNRGNGEDSFTLDSTFPIEFRPLFFADDGDRSREEIQATPPLQPEQSYKARLRVHLPTHLTDNQSKTFEVKIASRFDRNSFQWVRKTITATAPLLHGEYHSDRERAKPGEEVRYTIFLGNNGSSEAKEVKVRYNYHPALVFLSASPQPEKVESSGRAIYWNVSAIKSKENQKIEVVFKVGDETPAGQQILNRGLFLASVGGEVPFLSPPVSVTQVSSVRVEGSKEEIRVVSGDQVYLPFTLTNLGNGPDNFSLKGAGVPSDLTLYYDKNQDGLFQPGEPVITETPLLGTRENFPILVGVKVPTGRDGEKLEIRLDAQSKRDGKTLSGAARPLLLSLPMVVVQTQLQSRDSLPGGVISYQSTVTNTGTGLAKNVVITEMIPPDLEFVHSDPEPTEGEGKKWIWKLNDLGPQQKRTVSVSLRIRKGLQAGTVVQKQTLIRYQDLHGNGYPLP